MKQLEKMNVLDYYKLTDRILKLGVLSAKDASHLAIMFADAAELCSPKNKSIDGLYNKILDASIEHSKR